jgi:hypothetical protein
MEHLSEDASACTIYYAILDDINFAFSLLELVMMIY